MGAKRRRLALSCVACRRRKVKCGREVPSCMRCVRSGHADICSYVQYEEQSQISLPTPTDDSPDNNKRDASPCASWTEDADHWQQSSAAASQNALNSNGAIKHPAPPQTLDHLQQRVLELEKLVKATGSTLGLAGKSSRLSQSDETGAPHHEDGLQGFERSTFRGRSFKTQFFGPSHAVSLLLQFEELSAFVRDILKSPPVFMKFKDCFKDKRKALPFANDFDEEIALQQLVAMVPPKERTDAFLEQYYETYETTYRVLHTPTFTREYEQFWTDKSSARGWFVVQLLLVCASVNWEVAGDPDAFVGRSSVNRKKASTWIETAEAWFRMQSDKRTPMEFFQTHILLVIAKRNICYKVKRDWTITGTVLRRAMAAGFHREPTFASVWKKISVFEQEMRRRLWYTIIELEAQASCTRGMRASISADDWDCLPPSNIHDEDFNETTQVMPSPLPLTTFTRTSFLVSASSHVALRLEMLRAINSLSSVMTIATVMKYDGLTRAALDALPQYSSIRCTKISTSFSSVTSKLLLYEFLLLLHQPFATASLSESRYFYSRCARRDSALIILSIYTAPHLPLAQRLILSNTQDANLRACLATCHDIVVASSRPGACIGDMTHDRERSIHYIKEIVELFATRVKRLGQGFQSYWITSAALSLVQSRMNVDEPVDKFIKEAAGRVLDLQNEIIAVQLPGFDGDGSTDHADVTTRRQASQRQGEAATGLGLAAAAAATADGATCTGQTNTASGGTAEASAVDSMCISPEFTADSFNPFDPFGQTVFDFDNFEIWNVDLGGASIGPLT